MKLLFLLFVSILALSQDDQKYIQFDFVGDQTESYQFKTNVYAVEGSFKNELAFNANKNDIAMDLTPTNEKKKSDIIWTFDLHLGTATITSNYFQIPSDIGTRVDLDKTTVLSYRFYLSAIFKNKHQLRLMYAPLSYESETTIPSEDIIFDGIKFLAGIPTITEYRFNSYRLSYMYHFNSWGKIKFRLGLSAKIRDAYTGVSQPSVNKNRRFTNLGFVPLFHVGAILTMDEKSFIDLDAEGAWAPQGYAVDIRTSYNRHLSEKISLGLGVGFLDGGAEATGSVTTFTTVVYGFGRLSVTF